MAEVSSETSSDPGPVFKEALASRTVCPDFGQFGVGDGGAVVGAQWVAGGGADGDRGLVAIAGGGQDVGGVGVAGTGAVAIGGLWQQSPDVGGA